MTTAAIYTRISKDKTGEGLGVANQLQACKKFIADKGWTLGTVYSDNDISATSGEVRPGFEKLLKDGPPIVVAFKQDRLSRDLMDTLRIKGAGITGHMTDGGLLDFSSSDAGMLTMIRSAIDVAEGQKRTERQKLRYKSDAMAGKIHLTRRPFGNNLDGSLYEPEATAVRSAALRIASGQLSFYGAAIEWNELGLRTSKTPNAGGKEWAAGTVRNFFVSERLIGKRVYEGVTYTLADWIPLLDEVTFEQIQAHINSRKTGVRGKRTNPFMHLLTGIAECGECHVTMNIQYRAGGKQRRTYKCTTPRHTSRTADPLEELVINDFLYLLPLKGADKILNPDASGSLIASLRTTKIQSEAKHALWVDEAITEGLSPSMIAQKESKHRTMIEDLEAQIIEADKDNIFAGLVWSPSGTEIWQLANDLQALNKEMRTRWDGIILERKRTIIKALYKNIIVHRGASQSHKFDPTKIELVHTPLWQKLREAE